MRELKGEKLEAELKRIEALKQYEKEYEHLGYVCGIDEVGRGNGNPVGCAFKSGLVGVHHIDIQGTGD